MPCMNLQALLTDRRAGKLAFSLSCLIPAAWGPPLARRIAGRIASAPDAPTVDALRLNRWVVSEGRLDGPALDAAARRSLEQMAEAFFHLFRSASRPQSLGRFVEFSPQVEELITRSRQKRHGLMVVGVHMAGFDLVLQAISAAGAQVLGLSLPQANEAIEWQHAFRRQAGLEILPASIANLRQVIERLGGGEMAVTGIDRPMAGLKYRPRFFGRPALLPTHHVYLALKARVPVMVLAALRGPDGIYRVSASPEIRLRGDTDRSREMLSNAERILEVAAEMICRSPDEWVVPHPVWPEAASEVPPRAGMRR